MHATCPAQLILLDLITRIIFYTNTRLLENNDPLIFTTNPPLFSSQVTKCMLDVYYQFAMFCYTPLRKSNSIKLISDGCNQTAQKQFITTNKSAEYTIIELKTTID
jgi:hypothetical protein